MSNRHYKDAPRRVKDATSAAMVAGGSVTGYAATFDRTPDAYGDVIAPGAFAASLERWAALREDGKYIPLLYGHSTDDPAYNIGRVIEAEEDERGLRIVAEFDADNEKAQYVRKLVQEGRLYQFSFAYEIRDAGPVELEDGGEAYELRDVELFEVSLVQIPANQNAIVTGIKSVKAGRVLSAKNADAIKEAITLLQSVLDEAGMEGEPKQGGGEPKANPKGEPANPEGEEPEEPEGEEPKANNARAKDTLARINEIQKG